MAGLANADKTVFLGPVSEFVGRKKVLHYSFAAFFRAYLAVDHLLVDMLTATVLNFPVAFGGSPRRYYSHS